MKHQLTSDWCTAAHTHTHTDIPTQTYTYTRTYKDGSSTSTRRYVIYFCKQVSYPNPYTDSPGSIIPVWDTFGLCYWHTDSMIASSLWVTVSSTSSASDYPKIPQIHPQRDNILPIGSIPNTLQLGWQRYFMISVCWSWQVLWLTCTLVTGSLS